MRAFLFAVFFFDCGDFVDAALMSAALELGPQKYVDYFESVTLADYLFTHCKNVCVVMPTGKFGAVAVVTVRAPHTRHFICDDGNAYARKSG